MGIEIELLLLYASEGIVGDEGRRKAIPVGFFN
jgi:hypothetical protein